MPQSLSLLKSIIRNQEQLKKNRFILSLLFTTLKQITSSPETGLGVATVKTTIEKHSNKIRLKSKEGTGSSFFMQKLHIF